MDVEEGADGDEVGVVGHQAAVIVDDRVDRVDRVGRGGHLIDEGDDVFLPRHGNGAAAYSQAAHTGDGRRDVVGGERLVYEIEVEDLIKVVVESGADIRGPGGQGDAQSGVLGDVSHVPMVPFGRS